MDFFKKDFIYLFERDSEREYERGEGQREKQTPYRVGSLMQDSIPGLWDHDLSWSQLLNQMSHPGTPTGTLNSLLISGILPEKMNVDTLSLWD